MTIHVGITGTRAGGNAKQILEIRGRLNQLGLCFHHGDCIGVDQQGFVAASGLGYHTVAHPPIDPKWRAFTPSDEIVPAKPYMARNFDIVQAVSLLIVVPSGPEADQPRSGTWATYRMAVKAGVETVVIEP